MQFGSPEPGLLAKRPKTFAYPLGTGVPVPPAGYTFLVDADGAYLTDEDGAYLMEAV